MEHKQVALPTGISVHYVTEGTGKRIVFVHGFPEFWYAWKDQIAEFGKTHEVVAPDLRGYNLSSKPQDPQSYQLTYLVEDLKALLDSLGDEPCALVGHDWGGIVSWAFAMAYPGYLEQLIILNAPHPLIFQRELRQNPAQQQASGYMQTLRSPEAEAMLSANNYAFLAQGKGGGKPRPYPHRLPNGEGRGDPCGRPGI